MARFLIGLVLVMAVFAIGTLWALWLRARKDWFWCDYVWPLAIYNAGATIAISGFAISLIMWVVTS